jgi:hypothetical protein
MSVQVSDRQNGGHVAFCDEEYAKRKAMKNGSSNLTADERKLEGRLLNPDECCAQCGEEFGSEAASFGVIPRTGLFGVEFCLRPNVEPGHLSAAAKVLLNALDDFSPRPGVAGRLTMRREPLLQQGLLPLVQGHLVNTGRNAVPQRLYVVDLILDP